MSTPTDLQHFYIPEDQSIYLLSHADAKKLKDWFALCTEQLTQLGYKNIDMIGKGAFGFAFAGESLLGDEHVFKFSRINLPQHVQDRLEEEAFMLSQVHHRFVPSLIQFQQIGRQAILVMQRARGEDLEKVSLRCGPLPISLVLKIAAQLADILLTLRGNATKQGIKPIVHGDIKPSNIVWDDTTQTIGLIDWGSCVYAQLDETGQHVQHNVMDLMSGDLQQTNARLGDVYFIGDEQLNGALSSPRFDEQGLASTLYALASGQSSRFGRYVITPASLGFPKFFADILSHLMSDDPKQRRQGGDAFFKHVYLLKNIVIDDERTEIPSALIPSWASLRDKEIETVVYSSRKSYLRQQSDVDEKAFRYIDDAQFDRYYKNYMQGMGETEKAFISAVSRLGKYPVVGGLAVRWQPEGVFIDSSLNLFEPALKVSFDMSVNNVVTLARALHREGVFKCCMFNARDTLHIERERQDQPFEPLPHQHIPFEKSRLSVFEDASRMHSYFEDGEDPDELLRLPQPLLDVLAELNQIHHTGCIIFESLPTHLKIHNYYKLLDHRFEDEFRALLQKVLEFVPLINGSGISGFMKLPYKDTRFFEHQAQVNSRYYC
ncbi:protein kinase domain-containing protein [Alteromonas oceanisediminis]|uniref:protein kinase domain-containing protein n=1 Tax=Alteromonas oceanisediminis TaxID=2836180 RepID=UPI001BD95CC4|nr:phosphotransferase [Alteromonas oceanisediminis]MBT0587133.1 phosphotransferase [Alteromonas oceanisediminis]